MLKSAIKFAVLVLAAAPFAGAQQIASLTRPAHAVAETGVVARVNGVALTQRELQAGMTTLFPYYSAHGGKVPASAETEIRQKALDRMVLEELVFQEARRRGIQPAPGEVEKRINTARKKLKSAEEFQRIVAQQYGTQQEFRRRAVRALLIEKLWDRQVTRPAQPPTADLLQYYRQNKAKFVVPESVWLQSISIHFPENATQAKRDQARKQAEELLPKAQATKTPEEFGVLAEKHSQDDWRVMNGDHSWVHRGTVAGELETAFSMKTGQVSGIIASKVGYHILRVNGRRAAKQLSFVEVKKTIRESLQKEREAKLRKQFEEQLRRKAKIEVL
jgi:parvulin-like peptidyl-prolyl isomerase